MVEGYTSLLGVVRDWGFSQYLPSKGLTLKDSSIDSACMISNLVLPWTADWVMVMKQEVGCWAEARQVVDLACDTAEAVDRDALAEVCKVEAMALDKVELEFDDNIVV